jgi:hypothetical protein
LHLRVELDAEDGIRGSASDDNGVVTPFEGWLDLLALLEHFRQDRHRSPGPERGD